MPIAAAPQYLGKDFKDASPALRFGPLLSIWTSRDDQARDVQSRSEKRSEEGNKLKSQLEREGMDATIAHLLRDNRLPHLWKKNDSAAKTAWKDIAVLTAADKSRMTALLARQNGVFATFPRDQALCVEARSMAPFTTGLGNAHPLENGFAFLNPYGLPYFPGSGVKGVLRQSARELASGEWGDPKGWGRDYVPENGGQSLPSRLSALDILFGIESNDGDREHLRGVLGFWDVIPQIKGDALAVDIMTPHQSAYYQQKETGVAPHDCGQPVPIAFLTVPPESTFAFFVTCDLGRLGSIAPDLARDGAWKHLLQGAVKHAFAWLGFGAKTAVGYGVMDVDADAASARADADAAREKELARAQMSEARQKIEGYIDYMRARHEALRGRPARIGTEYQKTQELARAALEAQDWTSEEKEMAADAIMKWLPMVVTVNMKDERKKLKLSQLRPET